MFPGTCLSSKEVQKRTVKLLNNASMIARHLLWVIWQISKHVFLLPAFPPKNFAMFTKVNEFIDCLRIQSHPIKWFLTHIVIGVIPLVLTQYEYICIYAFSTVMYGLTLAAPTSYWVLSKPSFKQDLWTVFEYLLSVAEDWSEMGVYWTVCPGVTFCQ